jgi:hypothetical protein
MLVNSESDVPRHVAIQWQLGWTVGRMTAAATVVTAAHIESSIVAARSRRSDVLDLATSSSPL